MPTSEQGARRQIGTLFKRAKTQAAGFGCLGLVVLAVLLLPFYLFWLLTAFVFEKLAVAFSDSGGGSDGTVSRVMSLSFIATAAALSQATYFVFVVLIFGWPNGAGELGDMFGGYTAFITSLSLVFVLLTVYIEGRQIRAKLDRLEDSSPVVVQRSGFPSSHPFVVASYTPSASGTKDSERSEAALLTSGPLNHVEVQNLTRNIAINVRVYELAVLKSATEELEVNLLRGRSAKPGDDHRDLGHQAARRRCSAFQAAGVSSSGRFPSRSRWVPRCSNSQVR